MKPRSEFETSLELKALFLRELRAWSARHNAGLKDLAQRCGVSASYLAHIGRYGRIPSKPILLLLILNFEMKDPQALLSAAGVQEPWPYQTGTHLIEAKTQSDPGFLSVRLDMNGLVEALAGAIREKTGG
jgi:hypothetical protein